ncbi:MAG: hypothetical protein F9K44_05585 [Hyphomicrobiaceae bacterium]|nr:MAG: hypothetical protein F9K44_05585 [Hyphomicrobiaceae bacterium]
MQIDGVEAVRGKAKAIIARLHRCELGEIDLDFGILAAVFLAGLYFMHIEVSQYYNTFGSILTSVIR